MVTLINPPSKLHYLRNVRSPANLGCTDCPSKYNLRGHPALRGLGSLRAIGDATGAGVPAGTVLGYTATWGRTNLFTTPNWNDPNGVQSAIQGILANQWGIVVDSQFHSTSDFINLSGKSGFTLQVHTNSDYGAPDDIRSIIDGEIYKVLSVMPNSTIRVISAATGAQNVTATLPANMAAAVATAQAGYQDAIARGDQVSASQFAAQIQQLTGQKPPGVSSWLSDNWPWVAAAVGGVIVAREIL